MRYTLIMHTIKLTISYDGTGYNGWQVQPEGKTVQGEVEKAIAKVYKKEYRLHGAGRTDSGVHAIQQVAHFKVKELIPAKKISLALNKVLPKDIVIKKAEEVDSDFHARFGAKSKTYAYYISNTKSRDPFKERYAWGVTYKLDVKLMRKEAKSLIGEHNFKSFQAADKSERSSVRTISKILIKHTKSDITVEIIGNGFLYNMVRNIVGTLVDIGRGYLPPGSMQNILNKQNRTQAGPTAPAKGLFLVRVRY